MAKSRCTEHKVGSSALRSPCGHALFENGSSEVRMLPFCGGDKAPVKTNSLEKPLCVCVCVTVRFGHVHSSSCCQRKVVGKWTCRWRLLLGWMDHKKHASLAYYEMVCEDCKKENMKNNDGKWNIRTKEPMTRGLHYIEKYWIYYMHYNTMLISLYYP